MFVVSLPTELHGDLRQLTCIPHPGDWIDVDSLLVPYQQGQDEEIDKILTARAANFVSYSFLENPEYKYQVVHQQRYEPYGRSFYVAPGDEVRPKYTITVGTEVAVSSFIEAITGWTAGGSLNAMLGAGLAIGNEARVKGGVDVPFLASAQAEGAFKSEVNFKAELAATIKGDYSKSEKVGKTLKKAWSYSETTEIWYTIYGGKTGKRCVMWQIVDRYELRRPFDRKPIFEFQIPIHKELLTYPFQINEETLD